MSTIDTYEFSDIDPSIIERVVQELAQVLKVQHGKKHVQITYRINEAGNYLVQMEAKYMKRLKGEEEEDNQLEKMHEFYKKFQILDERVISEAEIKHFENDRVKDLIQSCGMTVSFEKRKSRVIRKIFGTRENHKDQLLELIKTLGKEMEVSVQVPLECVSDVKHLPNFYDFCEELAAHGMHICEPEIKGRSKKKLVVTVDCGEKDEVKRWLDMYIESLIEKKIILNETQEFLCETFNLLPMYFGVPNFYSKNLVKASSAIFSLEGDSITAKQLEIIHVEMERENKEEEDLVVYAI